MDFRATPIDVVMLLLAAFGAYAAMQLTKRKLESNLPLLFYCAVVAFVVVTGHAVNTYLFVAGMFAALLLRFEFMNRAFTNVVWLLELAAICGISFLLAAEAFGIRTT